MSLLTLSLLLIVIPKNPRLYMFQTKDVKTLILVLRFTMVYCDCKFRSSLFIQRLYILSPTFLNPFFFSVYVETTVRVREVPGVRWSMGDQEGRNGQIAEEGETMVLRV